MIAVAAEPVLNPKLVLDLLEGEHGELSFEAVMRALQERGLDPSKSRELIWQVLALGFIEFTADRSSLRLRPREERVA